MRVIGGRLRGRKLTPFDCEKIRPTADKARESLFNILRDKVTGGAFLDLFGGTGAVGIEAYSRGANSVVIVEAYKDSFKIAQKNLELIGNPAEIELKNFDALIFLKTAKKSFDVIFLDPPYKSDILPSVLKEIEERGALSVGGVIVAETETPYSGETFSFKITDERKYGRTRFTFFERKEK